MSAVRAVTNVTSRFGNNVVQLKMKAISPVCIKNKAKFMWIYLPMHHVMSESTSKREGQGQQKALLTEACMI